MVDTCRTCSFYNFVKPLPTGEDGQCRRRALTALHDWIHLRSNEWCGEYEQRKTGDTRGLPAEPEKIMPLRILWKKIEQCKVCLNGAPYVMCADHQHELLNLMDRIKPVRPLTVVQEIIKKASDEHDEEQDWKKPHTGRTTTSYQDLDTVPDGEDK